MSRFLKSNQPNLRGYAGLAMFAIAYLCVLAIILTPEGSFVSAGGATVTTFSP